MLLLQSTPSSCWNLHYIANIANGSTYTYNKYRKSAHKVRIIITILVLDTIHTPKKIKHLFSHNMSTCGAKGCGVRFVSASALRLHVLEKHKQQLKALDSQSQALDPQPTALDSQSQALESQSQAQESQPKAWGIKIDLHLLRNRIFQGTTPG